MIRGKNFWYYSRLSSAAYRFENDPPEDEMRGHIEAALDDMGVARIEGDMWKPRFVRIRGELINSATVLGRRLVFQRTTRGGGVVQDPGVASLGLSLADDLTSDVRPITAAPAGKVWLHVSNIHEPREAFELVPEDGRGVCLSDTKGMVYWKGQWKEVVMVKMGEVGHILDKATPEPDQETREVGQGVGKASGTQQLAEEEGEAR